MSEEKQLITVLTMRSPQSNEREKGFTPDTARLCDWRGENQLARYALWGESQGEIRKNHITYLVHLLGRREKTVNNCFSEAETAQSNEPTKGLTPDNRRLCDGGGEPAFKESEVRVTGAHLKIRKTI